MYDLVSAGVLELRNTQASYGSDDDPDAGHALHLEESHAALRAGAADRALAEARAAISLAPAAAEPRLALARALGHLGRHAEAVAELRDAVKLDALNVPVHLELGFAAVRHGDLGEAVGSWERYLRLRPDAPDAPRVRTALDAASRLRDILRERAHV